MRHPCATVRRADLVCGAIQFLLRAVDGCSKWFMGPILKTTSPETRIPIDLQRKREASRHTAATIPVQGQREQHIAHKSSKSRHPSAVLPRPSSSVPRIEPNINLHAFKARGSKTICLARTNRFLSPGAKRFLWPEQIVFRPGSKNDLFGPEQIVFRPGAKPSCLARTNRF